MCYIWHKFLHTFGWIILHMLYFKLQSRISFKMFIQTKTLGIFLVLSFFLWIFCFCSFILSSICIHNFRHKQTEMKWNLLIWCFVFSATCATFHGGWNVNSTMYIIYIKFTWQSPMDQWNRYLQAGNLNYGVQFHCSNVAFMLSACDTQSLILWGSVSVKSNDLLFDFKRISTEKTID